RRPPCSGQAILRRVNGVAGALTGKISNKERNILRALWIAIVAQQEVSRPKDVENILGERDISRIPAIERARKRPERRTRRDVLGPVTRLQHDGGASQKKDRDGKSPLLPHAVTSRSLERMTIRRCRANNIKSETTKISHPEKAWKNP